MMRKETYALFKDFVKGFAVGARGGTKEAKKESRKETFGVINTYFPLNGSENKEVNADLRNFYDELVAKELTGEIDPQRCLKKILDQHGEEMSFPKPRCSHCNGYGAYAFPEDNGEVKFCPKYKAISDNVNDWEDLTKEDSDRVESIK